MKIVIDDLAKQTLINVYYFNFKYSPRNAIEFSKRILSKIHALETFPYIGKPITELSNNNFRELIFRKNKHSTYRIIYYISKAQNIIYIINIISCKQNLNKFLKSNNYFKKYYNL